MGTFRVDCEVSNLQLPHKTAVVHKLLVDTGAEFTWIPEARLRVIGIGIAKKDVPFLMANGQQITRSVGYAMLRAGEFETVDEVVFGEPGDRAILGAHTLEGFGAVVDSRSKRLIAAEPHPAALACA